MKLKLLFQITILVFGLNKSFLVYGLSFQKPVGNSLIGKPKLAVVKEGEDFSDVALSHGVGYYEIFETNPGVDPDNPPGNTALIIPTQYILPNELKSNTIVINLAEMRLYFQTAKDQVYIFPVGIGKEDWPTPIGEMTIVQKIKNPTWIVPDSIYEFRKKIGKKINKIVPPGPDNPLGKFALRLSQRKYLIHGTNYPSGVGRRSTAGCLRLYNEDIEQLYNMVKLGTKVIIVNQPYKAMVINNKLYLEAHMPLFEQRIAMGENLQSVYDVVAQAIEGYNNLKVNWQQVRKFAQEHLTLPRLIKNS